MRAWAALLLGFCAAGMVAAARVPGARVLGAEQRDQAIVLDQPDKVCASCHQAIYDRYEKTSMARGSGLALDGLIPGGFHHAASGVDYRVFLRDGVGWMSYSRVGGELQGERKLEYFVGSGHRGRTFLYQMNGRWFELPINFYTRRSAWDMAPAYDNAREMPAELPVDSNCLHCHASEVQTAEVTARNRYAAGPFRQGGIGCNACHGDPARHLAEHGHGAIVNPAKLSATRRDSACIQCHLEGDAVVYRPGKSLAQFKAGDELSDYAVYFVKAQEPTGGSEGRARGTSQYEALLRSACKRASGDRLTCTTCHDPHSQPSPVERVQYFRARCLSCHTGPEMKTHHAEQQDCAVCHMPSLKTSDISHEQVTDHDIERRKDYTERPMTASQGVELVPVGGFASDDRTLGLAYAQAAQRGDVAAGKTALRLLTKAAPLYPKDVELNLRLGYLQQVSGEAGLARASYTAVLAVDPWQPSALANLAVLDAGSGRLPEAVHLLERLTNADPSQSSAGLNLAFIECTVGHRERAMELTRLLLVDNPDNAQLREFQRSGTYAGQRCESAGEAAR